MANYPAMSMHNTCVGREGGVEVYLRHTGGMTATPLGPCMLLQPPHHHIATFRPRARRDDKETDQCLMAVQMAWGCEEMP